ncbi:MAG: anthranilate synthase component I, partial [Cyanobacteria bacterium J06636_27]
MTKELQPWHFRKLPLQERTGSDIFACLFISESSNKIATLLESPYPNNLNNPQLTRYSICAGSPRVIDGVQQMWIPRLGEVQHVLNRLLEKELEKQSENTNFDASVSCLPFTGGWLGWLGYDVAWEIETLPTLTSDNLPFPVAFWYEPECFTVLDHQEQTLWLAA